MIPEKGRGEHLSPIVIQYRCSSYDGPLRGVCWCYDQFATSSRYWFEMFHEMFYDFPYEDPQWPQDSEEPYRLRFFHLIELTEEQISIKDFNQKLFEEYYGKHNRYNKNGSIVGATEPIEKWKNYQSDLRKEEIPIREKQIIGWFESRDIWDPNHWKDIIGEKK